MSTVLVIGGSRLVGPLLVQRLRQRGDRIVLFNRQTRGTVSLPGVQCVKGDRNSAADLADVTAWLRPEIVFDACCYDAHQADLAIEAFRGVKRYVWTSTVGAYAEPRLFPISENAPLGAWPLFGQYGANKAAAEQRFRAAFLESGFPVVAVRPSYVLGRDNYVEREAFFVSRLQAGLPVVLPGEGCALLHFAFAEDVAEATVRLSEAVGCEGEGFNVASEETASLRDVVTICAEELGVVPVFCPFDPAEWMSDRMPYDPAQVAPFPNEHVVLSTEKLRRITGVAFAPFDEQWRSLVRWFAERLPAFPVKLRPAEREILGRAGYSLKGLS